MHDTIDSEIEQYIEPLIGSINRLKIEKFDLSTKEKALQAIPMLDGVLQKIEAFRKNAAILKTLLEEKRDKMNREIE